MGVLHSLGNFLASPVGQGVSTVGRATLGLGRRVGGMGLSAAFGGNAAPTREIYYQQNWTTPNLLADPGDIIDLYHAGKLPAAGLAWYLRWYGIDITDQDDLAEVWRRVVEHQRPSYDLELYKKWMRQGRLSWEGLQAQVQHIGISNPEHANLWLNDYELFSEPIIREMYKLGLWDQKTVVDELRKLGFRQGDSEVIMNAWTVTVSPADALYMRHRGMIDINQTHEYLHSQGILRKQDRDRLIDMSSVVPTPSDAITMAVKDVFDPQLPGKQQAIAEYNAQIGLRELFAATGIGPVKIPGVPPTVGDKTDVGLLYWLAHYHHVSPTQAYEFLHRYRPNRVNKWRLPGQNDAEVQAMITDINDVRTLLKVADYNPYWRDRLAAASYRVIGRVDIRRIYSLGVYGEPLGSAGFQFGPQGPQPIGPAEIEASESYQDMGYAKPDANTMALFTARMHEDKSYNKIRTTLKSVICQAVDTGIGTNAENIQILRDVGFPKLEAEAIVTSCDIRRQVRYVQRAIKLTRRAYLGGRIDITTVTARLNQIGVSQAAIKRYVDEWELDLMSRAKEPQAAQLCEWYGNGLLSLQEFRARLARLGWSNVDAARIINHCLVGIEARSKREMEKAAKLLERKAKEKQAAERYALRQFLSGRLDIYINEWYKQGTITLEDVRQTLVLRGWSKADVERYICDLTGNLPPCQEAKEEQEEQQSATE